MSTTCKLFLQGINKTLMTKADIFCNPLVVHPKKGKTQWHPILHCLFNFNFETFLTEHRVLWEQWRLGSFQNLERPSWGGERKTGCWGGRKAMTSESRKEIPGLPWGPETKLMEPTEQAEEGFCETGQPGGRKPVHEELTGHVLEIFSSQSCHSGAFLHT